MCKWLRAVSLALTTTFVALPSHAQNLQKVRTFTQTNYPGFIQYVTRVRSVSVSQSSSR